MKRSSFRKVVLITVRWLGLKAFLALGEAG
jgi:hypothetical protein